MIFIDGSFGEGGGQIIRSSLLFSAITGKPFTIQNIRKGRKVVGLRPQHIASIRAVQKICSAHSVGDKVGSTELEFIPGPLRPKSFEMDIGSAGSISLVFQSILPALVFARKRVKIKLFGGTDVRWSPSFDYFKEVILPSFYQYGKFDIKLFKRGYYPKGGGEVELSFVPYEANLPLIREEKGELLAIKGLAHASLDLMEDRVCEKLVDSLNKDISMEYRKSDSSGYGVTLWAIYGSGARVGADALGEDSFDVFKKLKKEMVAAVDEYLADNLIPFLALFGGSFVCSRVSLHTKTNIFVAEQFLDVKFKIDGNKVSLF